MATKEDVNQARERKEKKVKTFLPSLGDGQWQLDELIGKGGNASVFRVSRGSGRNRIEKAVKLISIDARYVDLGFWTSRLKRGEISLEEYQKNAWNALNDTIPELRFMALLSASHNVLAYEDYLFFETEEDHQWNVMILMDMLKPLSQHMLRPGASELDVLQMWRDMGMVLQLCAQFGVLHLDIKEANILVTEDGRYKLIDWGQACYRAEIVRLVREHKSVRKGTESYMAPEVFNTNPPVAYDERADQYSLGLVAYYYFNNMRLPFADRPWGQLSEAERRQIKLRRVSGTEALPRPEGLADDIWQVLQRTCAYSPAGRYATAADMVHAIEILIAARAKKRKGRGKGIALSLAAIMAVAGIAGAWLFLGEDEGKDLSSWQGFDLGRTARQGTTTTQETKASEAEKKTTNTPTPTPTPTLKPTDTPTPTPTPTLKPTDTPTPTPTPTLKPTDTPTPTPTPTLKPTDAPTPTPTPELSQSLQKSLEVVPGLIDGMYLKLPETKIVRFAGAGDPNQELTITRDGQKEASVVTDSKGKWMVELNGANWPENKAFDLVFHYEQDKDGKLDGKLTIYVDTETMAPTIVGDLNENTEVLTGFADTGSSVTLELRGKEIETVQVDALGTFVFSLPVLNANDRMVLTSTDSLGNVARTEAVVKVGKRDAVTIDIKELVVRPTKKLVISGSAAPSRTLNMSWTLNGSAKPDVYQVEVDENGRWNVTIDSSSVTHGSSAEVKVGYKDGLTSELDQRISLTFDAMCSLAPEAQSYTEKMSRIAGTTDPGATVMLSLAPGKKMESRADTNGYFKFENLTLTAGTRIQLTAQDAVGNMTTLEYSVQADQRAQITIEKPMDTWYVNAQDASLTVEGTAQPRMSLSITVMGKVWDVLADNEGRYEKELPVKEMKEGVSTISVAYTDGYCAECTGSAEFTLDRTAPMITVDRIIGDDLIEATSGILSGQTEPGALVTVSVNDRRYDEYANHQGTFVFYQFGLTPGDEIGLIAKDKAGNETSTKVSVVEEIRDVRLELVRPRKDGETIRNAKLGIRVNLLKKGNVSVYYLIEQNGMEIYTRVIAPEDMKAMAPDDLQKQLDGYDDLLGEYEGYSISIQETVPTLGYDDFTLKLYTDDLGEDPVLLASRKMTNGRTETIEGVDDDPTQNQVTDVRDRYTTSSYGFGLDEMAVTSFAASQVYFTGWSWKNNNRESEIFEVEIDGIRYSQGDLIAAGGNIMVYRSTRDVAKEYPELIPGVKPLTATAGVIVLVDAPFLSEGVHNLNLILIHNSEIMRFEGYQVNIANPGYTDDTLIRTLQNIWK